MQTHLSDPEMDAIIRLVAIGYTVADALNEMQIEMLPERAAALIAGTVMYMVDDADDTVWKVMY